MTESNEKKVEAGDRKKDLSAKDMEKIKGGRAGWSVDSIAPTKKPGEEDSDNLAGYAIDT